MEININVPGYGSFLVKDDKIVALVQWLTINTVKVNEQNVVREVTDNKFTGRELLNG